MEKTVPIIDLKNFPAELGKLRAACEEWGCFRLANHSIPPPLMAEMKELTRTLFDLPADVKSRNADVIPGTGYIAPNQFNPLFESLGFYDLASPAAVDKFCSQLDASPSQREVIEKYTKAIQELTTELAEKVGESLGLKKRDVFSEWVMQFRINKYNFRPETVGSHGLQIHTDYGFITVLQDDEDVGGLEVMDESGQFVAVKPHPPGTLLVNLGDVAKAWSNGRLYSVKHRVESKQAGVRISMAAFMLGPKEAKIEAPDELVDSEHPRLYKSFVYEEQRMLRIKSNLHGGEALELFRIQS